MSMESMHVHDGNILSYTDTSPFNSAARCPGILGQYRFMLLLNYLREQEMPCRIGNANSQQTLPKGSGHPFKTKEFC